MKRRMMVLGLARHDVLILSILAGVVGLAACDGGPTAPTPRQVEPAGGGRRSLTAPAPTQTEVDAGTSEEAQLQSLTDRLAELQSADVSAQSQHAHGRLRALIAALTALLSPGGGGDRGGGDGGGVAPLITIADAGVNPTEIRISTGQRVQIVNNSSQAREIQSNPHPFHTDCPPLNQPARLAPGASGFTGVFAQAGSCGFHDHLNPLDSRFRGQIVTDGGGTGGGDPQALAGR